MNLDKIEILKQLYEGRPTIPEMAKVIGKSYATVHKLLRELVVAGLVSPPRVKQAARDYHATKEGAQYLRENGYIKE
jgi:DNA-binding IclR family transcriptional regulator